MISALFIDDEVNLLEGMRRMLRPLRDRCEFHFISAPEEAIDLAHRACFDLVVSDMRMPRIQGDELMRSIREACPETLRVILSGQSSLESFFRALPCTHRYIAKPCEMNRLSDLIEHVRLAREILPSPEARRRVAQLSSLLCASSSVEVVGGYLKEAKPRIEDAREVLNQDLGASALFLHLHTTTTPVCNELPSDFGALLHALPGVLLNHVADLGQFLSRPRNAQEERITADLSLRARRAEEYLLEVVREQPELADRAILYWTTRLTYLGELLAFQCFGADGAHLPEGVTSGRLAAFLALLWGLPRPVVEILRSCGSPRGDSVPYPKLVELVENARVHSSKKGGGSS